jgi:hypothetical protein
MQFTISEQGISNLAPALARFQEEVKNPSNSATNPQFRSKYAPLDVVINTVKPILAKHGLSYMQTTGAEDESVIINTLVMHESGEWIQSTPLKLPAYQTKGGGVKEFNAQGAGSAITYGRRYQLSAMLGLSSEDDDDGNGQSQGYKDASTKPAGNTGGGLSAEEKEKRKQEALAKANAKKEAKEANKEEQETSAPETNNEEKNESSGEKITPQQAKAIGNLLNLLSKKKGEDFDKDAFLSETLAEIGAVTLEEASADNAKFIITAINAAMRPSK